MKRMIYAVLMSIAISLTISSCTEEEVAPNEVELQNGGAGGSTGKI